MLSTIKTVATSVGLALLSSQALAHPGHDHSAPSSVWIHAMYYGGIAVVAIGLVFFVARSLRSGQSSKQDATHTEEL